MKNLVNHRTGQWILAASPRSFTLSQVLAVIQGVHEHLNTDIIWFRYASSHPTPIQGSFTHECDRVAQKARWGGGQPRPLRWRRVTPLPTHHSTPKGKFYPLPSKAPKEIFDLKIGARKYGKARGGSDHPRTGGGVDPHLQGFGFPKEPCEGGGSGGPTHSIPRVQT